MHRLAYVIFTLVLTCLFYLSNPAVALAANNIESTYYYSSQDFQTLVGTRYAVCSGKIFIDGKETPYFIKQVDACPNKKGELLPRFTSIHLSKTCNICEKAGDDCQQVGCPPNLDG
jgi:hypothetical protein